VIRLDRWVRVARVVPLTCLWSSLTFASPSLKQDCRELSSEDSARVETRLLTTLMSRDAAELEISISCERGIAMVSASAGAPEERRSVALSGAVATEAILALAERALSQLLAPTSNDEAARLTAATPQPVREDEPSSAQQPPPPAATAPAAPARAAARDADPSPAARSARSTHDSHARADLSVQTWGSRAAASAVVGLEQAQGNWSYAFLAGGARPLSEVPLSTVTEWLTAAELAWQSSGSSGIRLSARLGLSLLAANPNQGVAASSGTLKSAGFLQLDISRPIWFGRFALAPGLGVRAFSARRAITTEGQTELQLSTPSAHLSVAALFRTSE